MIDDLVSIIMPAYNAEKYIEEAYTKRIKADIHKLGTDYC